MPGYAQRVTGRRFQGIICVPGRTGTQRRDEKFCIMTTTEISSAVIRVQPVTGKNLGFTLCTEMLTSPPKWFNKLMSTIHHSVLAAKAFHRTYQPFIAVAARSHQTFQARPNVVMHCMKVTWTLFQNLKCQSSTTIHFGPAPPTHPKFTKCLPCCQFFVRTFRR